MAEDIALQIPITADPNPLKQAMNEVKNHISGTVENIRNAVGAAGVMAAGYLKGAIESAAKSQESTERLEHLIENQGVSWEKAEGQVKKYTSTMMKLSDFSGGEAKAALTELLDKGMKLSDALSAENTMMDLADGKHIELTQAANILSDAYHGKTRALVGLGLATKEEIKNGISYADVIKRINERFGGSAQSELNTYNGQMKQFTNNMNSLKTSIGSYLLPYFNDLAKQINALAQHLNSLDPNIKKLIAGILATTAVLGLFIGGAGLLKTVLGILGPSVQALAALIGGLTLPIIAVIGAVVLLATAYVKNWGGMRDKTDEIIGYIKTYIMDAFNAVVSWFKEHWPQIKAIFEQVMKGLELAWNEILKPVLLFILQELKKVVDWVKENWPLIRKTIETVLNAIKLIVGAILLWISAFWKEHGETIVRVTKDVWDIIKTVIDMSLKIIGDVLKLIMHIITGDWKGAWNDIVDIVKTLFGGIGRIISDILDGVWAIFSDAAKTALNWGKNLINGFIDGIKSKINAVKDAVSDVIGGVKKFLGFNSPAEEGEGRHIVEWGANMIGGFMDGVRSQIPSLRSLMTSAIQAPGLTASVNIMKFISWLAPAGAGQNIFYVDIHADDLQQVISVVDLMNRFKQSARKGVL